MDADLYDEFGNYIGPELESDEDDQEDVEFLQARQRGTARHGHDRCGHNLHTINV
jgi:hypothetical protein